MKTKEEIVANWLPRYTKRSLNDFGEYILLTNFNKYVELFADKFNVPMLFAFELRGSIFDAEKAYNLIKPLFGE